jgi:GSH-dependent disulfide-bond oxidoreductase
MLSIRNCKDAPMIDLYVWPTPNAYKISIMLEETATPYRPIAVDIMAGDQFKPEFLAISPNNKMPAIIDPDGPGGQPISVFESGAILIYLAEKTGRFMPTETRARVSVLEWLMFQMASVGPMLGQAHHFMSYAPEKLPYAIQRYTNEAKRIYGVIDRRLSTHEYIAGSEYSIADMAIFPWTRYPDRQGVTRDEFPHFKRWFAAIEARPAVRKGLELLADRRRTGPIDDKAREVMFGTTQYAKR